jgi:phosphatidylinositol alpha-mannosyltransferase
MVGSSKGMDERQRVVEPMKIVQVCPYDINRAGGVQRHILALTAALRARGHEVLVVAPGSAVRETRDVFHLGRQREIGLSGTRFELTWARGGELRTLQEHLSCWKPDLLHFHTLWTPLMPFQLFRRWHGPVVATFHDTPPPGIAGHVLRFLFKGMSRWILGRIDGAIAVSPAPLAHLRPPARGTVPEIIPPAIDLTAMTADASKQGADGSLRYLFVGRLEVRKGVRELLQAWELVQRESSAASQRMILTIAGKGELSGVVLDARGRLGPDRLQFVESPDDATVRQLYGAADVFVAPSPFGESFGIVLVEAMASALPVIAAANAGYRGVLVGPGEVGLVPPGDIRALADKMLRFAMDGDLRKRLAGWGPQEAAQYDIRAVAARIEALYGRIVRAAGSAGARIS